MNDDLVVQKISKLLQNNTSFIGYALNGGIGTKINVRNTETGKTIQALSINVDSSGEVLVVKDSADDQYKAVTFKTAEKVSERIVQLRKTKPIDDKKTIEYTDSDIEVFYLFVKLIDTGSPVTSKLTSTWIRKGTSCTQFVGAYERCNYARRETIGGTSYTGLPYTPYTSLNACLNDDNGPDAKTPHGSKDETGRGFGNKIYSTKMTSSAEQNLLGALTSHDAYYGTSMKNLFGYGSILECGGGMYVNGWEIVRGSDGVNFFQCDFGYFPGYDTRCTSAMEAAGYCTSQGFISSKCPLPGQELPGKPSVGAVDNSFGHTYGWATLPYEFMYRRHFQPLYVNGSTAQGSFLILSVNNDQTPTIPDGFFPWTPGCPSGGNGGPYDGTGGNRFPDGPTTPQKRDMKLSTHKAEIWLGSSKKETAIKLYELGASDLFSGMYNAFIYGAEETKVDIENRLKRGAAFNPTSQEVIIHEKFYENRDKNIIDLRIDPRVWTYIIDNKVYSSGDTKMYNGYHGVYNYSLQAMVHHLYNRTINLSVVDKKLQVIHLKFGLEAANILSNTDCKAKQYGSYYTPSGDSTSTQSWKYQKTVTIKVKDWAILSTQNSLDTSDLNNNWNVDYISRQYLTSFGDFNDMGRIHRESASKLLLRHNADISINNLLNGGHYEQYNYSSKNILGSNYSSSNRFNGNGLYVDFINAFKRIKTGDDSKRIALGTFNWWELWNKTLYNKSTKRLSSVVGYERNYYQIVTSSGLNPNLDPNYITNNNGLGLSKENYFNYLPTKPLKYLPSMIKGIRDKTNTSSFYSHLQSREKILLESGYLFYFSDESTDWQNSSTFASEIETEFPIIPLDAYYGFGSYFSRYNLVSRSMFTEAYSGGRNISGRNRFDSSSWIQRIWAQLVYDEKVKIDIDSYKNVDFNFYIPANKYIKYSNSPIYTDSEYSFVDRPNTVTTIDTVLSPGTLDITKQVPIKKPTNVDLDPNMSFLLYLYPYVKVTKKTKEI
jgi:hypothetical protein